MIDLSQRKSFLFGSQFLLFLFLVLFFGDEVCSLLPQFICSQNLIVFLVILKVLEIEQARLDLRRFVLGSGGQHVGIGELIESVDDLGGLVLNHCQKDQQVRLGDSPRSTDLLHHFAIAFDGLEDTFDQPHDTPSLFLAIFIS